MTSDGLIAVDRSGTASKTGTDISMGLAKSQAEIEACQSLRYQVFYEDGGAKADSLALARKLDADGYDELCDHLMVSDGGRVVGTYRLLRQEQLPPETGFYTQSEFDIEPLLDRHKTLRFLELGRSCVLPEYRTKRVIEILWQAIWDYVRLHELDVMFGCASLPGADLEEAAPLLDYLQKFHGAPAEWIAHAHHDHAVVVSEGNGKSFSPRAILEKLPPLVKGYLRLGAYVGEGAVLDRQFGTIDVLIILPVSAIRPRYFARFGSPDDKPQPLMS